jgi:hypothetical protein
MNVMKMILIRKLMAITIATTTILGVSSIGANAEWKQDSNGWWNTEGNSYSTGWKQIDGKWYYFNSNGYMAHDTIVDGYKIDNNGVWIQNNTTNSNDTNNGIINNGGTNNNNITNNYYGNDNKNDNATVTLPITIPSNWTKITSTSYAINNRSPLIYQVKDTLGANQNDIVNGLELTLIEKSDYNYESKTYNGYKADCFEYLDTTKKGIERFYNIIIFNDNKVYNFVICGTQDNYNTDKQELENVLNSTLKFN